MLREPAATSPVSNLKDFYYISYCYRNEIKSTRCDVVALYLQKTRDADRFKRLHLVTVASIDNAQSQSYRKPVSDRRRRSRKCQLEMHVLHIVGHCAVSEQFCAARAMYQVSRLVLPIIKKWRPLPESVVSCISL